VLPLGLRRQENYWMTSTETIVPTHEEPEAEELKLKKRSSITGIMVSFAVHAAVRCINLFTLLQTRNDDRAISPLHSDPLFRSILKHQIGCACDHCDMEILITFLRAEHLFPNDSSADFRRWVAIMQPFTSIEVALLETYNERFVELCYPVLAWLIEKEMDAWYNRGF
jgi:hypothetical protein